MPYDVARVRGLIPALGDGWIRLDATAGMQPPEGVVSAVSGAFRRSRSAVGAPFPASRQSADVDVDAEARLAIADLVGADPRGVVLGPGGPAELLRRLADAVGDTWAAGDEIVVSRLDDAANVAPWLWAAGRRDVGVRWAEIDIETCELPTWQFDDLLTDATRVVAITAASGQVGTRVDVAAVAERTRGTGALLVVDACAAAAYGPVRMDPLGADVIALDAAAWGGPHVGALAFRTPALLDRLTACSLDPGARGPQRLEIGPQSFPQLAGLVASVDHLAALDDTATGTRRERLLTSLDELQFHQERLVDDLLLDLIGSGVTVLGPPRHRIPAVAFTHALPAVDVADHLARHGICVLPDTGERGVLAHLGTAEIGGVVRVGLGHY
ncbi:aminotransferase class V-fold PLP-dependent enzyme, partial [Pseudonocardia abyssalis]